jgi:lipopolysaccharide export system permease protein
VDLLLYFLPVTLTFVLPLAALFAAALTYGRLATDNEIDACKASGISPMTLIYPGFLLAVLVAIATLALSFHVTPYFVRLADQSINANLKQILFRHLQRRGFYRLPPNGRYAIYADYADPLTDSLYGVIVLKTRDAKIDQVIATEVAKVSFDHTDGFNEVRITARNTIQMGLGSEAWFEAKTLSLGQRIESLLADRIRFKRIDDMKRIQTDLLLFGPIEKAARQVYGQALTELTADDINRTAAAGRPYELAGPAAQIVYVTAARAVLGPDKTIQLPGPVEIVESDRSSRISSRRWQCDKATIAVEGEGWTPMLSLDLFNARSADVGGTLMMRYTVTGLAIPPSITAKATAPPLLETLTSPGLAAALSTGPSPQLTQVLDSLRRQIRNTLSEITAEVHSRLVFGIGCIPMILIGIVLGILKRGGYLLSAFAISCLPAIILIVGIVSGKQLTTNPGSQALSGPMLMWTGLAVLWILAFGLYRRLQSQ